MVDEQKVKISVPRRGHAASPETRVKLSAANMGNTNSLGCRRSEETKMKIGAASKGRIMSPETRAKMSIAQKGHITSPETRTKLSIAIKAVMSVPEVRAAMSGPLSSYWLGGKRVTMKKHSAKRRSLGFLALNSPFSGCEGHHVSKTTVIYVPKELNRGYSHDVWTGRGMKKINALAVQWLMGDGFCC